jgi:hypothetical protein
MKRTTVAYVDSSRDRTKRYVIIRRGNRFECTCLDFFFKEDRDEPCRHIKQVLKTEVKLSSGRVEVTKLAAVELTQKGVQILKERQTRLSKAAAPPNSVEP